MIEIEHSPDGDMIVVRASGTLTTKDYESAIPELEHAMELSNGPLRILMRLLVVSVVIVIGLGIFQKFSLQAEERLEPRRADEQALTGQS